MSEQTFPRRLRLRSPAEFTRILQSGRVVADDCLVVHLAPNPGGPLRLGLSIPRRTGNAVVRNRWKRLIREVFRRQPGGEPRGWDLVVRPRRGARCEFAAVARSLPHLIRRGTRPDRGPSSNQG